MSDIQLITDSSSNAIFMYTQIRQDKATAHKFHFDMHAIVLMTVMYRNLRHLFIMN